MTKYIANRVRGITKLRRTFNRIENLELKELRTVLEDGAKAIKRDAIGNAIAQDIRVTGKMIASIDYKLSSDKLTAIIGPEAKEAKIIKNPWNTSSFSQYKRESTRVRKKEAQWNLMKAWWAEFGTGPPIPQDPQPFMNPAFEKNKRSISEKARKAQAKVLRRASGGGS